jgi:anti-sigma-K factor RskA
VIDVAEHDQFADGVELYVLGALDEGDRRAFEAHLASCDQCASAVRSFAPAVSALAASALGPAPDGDVRARLLDRVRSRDAQKRPYPFSAGGRGFGVSWLVVAASIALAVLVGGYALELRSRVRVLERRLHQETLRADAGERRMADVRTTAANAQSAVSILTASDVARVELAGQAAAPKASARAFWSRSHGLVLTASNLPAPPLGRTYQLWVLTAQPAPISAGVLLPGADGSVTVRFDTPPDIPKPVAMAVTLEPAGGVPSPTGAKYLVGVAN